MKIRILLGLLATLVVSLPAAAQDSIASVKDNGRDYDIEGDVVTVWDDSFLLNDGSGQVVVDVRPQNTFALQIAGRDYVQVSGHLKGDKFIPLVIGRAGKDPVMFSGVDTLPDLPLDEVMQNTARYRIPHPAAPARAAQAATGGETSATPFGTDNLTAPPPQEASSPTSSSGVRPEQAVQPVSGTNAPPPPPPGASGGIASITTQGRHTEAELDLAMPQGPSATGASR